MNIGFAMTGSFCTFEKALDCAALLVAQGHDVLSILSFCAATLDTRFGDAASLQARLKNLTGHAPLTTLTAVEPIGPKALLDILLVAPCTGTTLARLALGLSDTPVSMAVKSHLRGQRPVVLAVSTNDALGASLRNIATLKNAKHIFFVPMAQDDPAQKPNSLAADLKQVPAALDAAMKGIQIQPLFFGG